MEGGLLMLAIFNKEIYKSNPKRSGGNFLRPIFAWLSPLKNFFNLSI